MNEEGRGRSPEASHAATGPVSGEMRRRGRRVRVDAGFAAAGAFTSFAGGGATGIGFFAGSGFRTAGAGRGTTAAGRAGCFKTGFFGAATRGAGFFFAGTGAAALFGGFTCFAGFANLAGFAGFAGFANLAGFVGFADFAGFAGFVGFAGFEALDVFGGADFGRATGLVVFFEDFAAGFGARLGVGFVRGITRRVAAEAGFFLEAAEAFPAFLPFAIGIAIPLRPLKFDFGVPKK